MPTPKLIVPRHALDEWTRCHRKWYYHNKLGLIPKEEPEAIVIGNMTHAGIAGGYRAGNDGSFNLDAAKQAVEQYVQHEFIGGLLFQNLVEDMIEYWWENQGKAQLYSEILGVEETFYIEAENYLIPWTADLIARRATGELVIVDHKTVGNVRDAVGFLPIDFQMRRYAAGGYQKYGEIPEIDYNMIRRELPPSFTRSDGSQPYLLTPTGRKSTRTDKPEDYLQFHRLLFTPKQITATLAELVGDLMDMEYAEHTGFYARSEIKGGYNGCTGCPYFGPCTREFDGNKLDGITLALKYNKEKS